MATTTHQDNLLELERRFQDDLDFINSIKDPTFTGVKLRFGKHLIQDLNFLKALTNNVTAINALEGSDTKNPLLVVHDGPKHIMGKLVGTGRVPVTDDTLLPTKSDTAKFANKVSDLYNGYLGLKDSDVLAILNKPGGETLLRGVAKKAGVANWESIDAGDIDFSFFADIREGIKDQAAGKLLNADIEDKLAEDDEEKPVAKKAVAKKAVAKKKITEDDEDA